MPNITLRILPEYTIINAKVIDNTSFSNVSETFKTQKPIIKSNNNIYLTPISILLIVWDVGSIAILFYVLIINLQLKGE
ncbi:hypothetical protein LL036_15945 [Clostridium sp. CF011]|nr:hypothetical protein [Clostridium sp. CF011]WAG69467.1 hypothetical protein LL036_15945 [Clostridium sp. CF011]